MDVIFPFIGHVIIPIDEYFWEGLKPPTRYDLILVNIEKASEDGQE